MKILYINSNTLQNKTADIKQSISTVNALVELCDITYYSSWIGKKDITSLEKFFNIQFNFEHKKAPIAINTKYFLFEKITRLIFCIFLIIHLFMNKYDVVLTRDFSFLYLLSLIPNFLKPKVKIIFESHKIYHKTSKKVNYIQEKRALSQAKLFLTNSGGTKKGLIDFFNMDENKILILHNGVDLSIFKHEMPDYDYLQKEYGISRNDKIIIYTGSFLPWKGVEYLIYAFDQLNTIKNIKLLLVGGVGEYKKNIENIVYRSRNKNQILIRGMLNQDELVKLMTVSNIAVIPNNITPEGENYTSPVKAFEYIAMGLPIISSRLLSMMEIFEEHENCLFFTPEDTKDLAKKIEMLLDDKSLCMKISKNNVVMSKFFSWENRAKKLIDFIKSNFE